MLKYEENNYSENNEENNYSSPYSVETEFSVIIMNF